MGMIGNQHTSRWLLQCTPKCREVIHSILRQWTSSPDETTTLMASIIGSPTVGAHKDVRLVIRDGRTGAVVLDQSIMRNGVLVA